MIFRSKKKVDKSAEIAKKYNESTLTKVTNILPFLPLAILVLMLILKNL